MARIGLVYDLRKEYLAAGHSEEDVAEFDSEGTVDALAETLGSLGHPVDRIGSGQALCRRLVAGDRWDAVFTVAEGLRGRSREAQVPAVLELFGVSYTFSDPLVCAVTLDKAVAKRLIRDAGLPTPGFAVIRGAGDVNQVPLEYPLFVKPLAEGTGKGIDARSLVQTPKELQEVCEDLLGRIHGEPVLVEEFLPGREFTVGVLGQGASARVLGAMEVRVIQDRERNIYSYETKELSERLVEYGPILDLEVRERVERLGLQAYQVLECRDAGRVDIRLDGGGMPSFLEVNPLPGLHPTHSDLPMIAAQEGMPYATLIGAILDGALARGEAVR